MQMAELHGKIYKIINTSGSTSWQLHMRFDGYYVSSGVITKRSYSLEYIEELRRVLSEKRDAQFLYEEAVEFMKTYPTPPEHPKSPKYTADTARVIVREAGQQGQVCLYMQKPLKRGGYTSPIPLRHIEFGLFTINGKRVFINEFDFKQLNIVIPVHRVILNGKPAWVQSNRAIPEHPRWREISKFYPEYSI